MRLLIAAVVLAFTTGVSAADVHSRPNLVFMFTDDQRFDAIAAVQREQGDAARFPWLKTPNLDRLAAEGVRFRNAFVVNSLCSPSRACVLTGRYNHHNGVVNNHTPLDVMQPLFSVLLRDAGYATGYFGKFHMGQQRDRPGFDHYASFVGQGRYYDCPLLVDGVQKSTTGFVDDVTTGYAIDFIQKCAQQKDRPFMLWLGFKSPHGPLGAPDRFKSLYENEVAKRPVNADAGPPFPRQNRNAGKKKKAGKAPAVPSSHHEYFRHITAVDENVGRMLDALRMAGVEQNTVVIFTSDNGYYLGEHTLGDKRSAYDESLRVPLLVKWPQHQVRAGQVVDAMTLNIDYAPTMLDLAGVTIPKEMQGRSLRPLLQDQVPEDWRRAFFYEYFYENPYFTPTITAVRTETHKCILYPGHDEWTELFDLSKDPYEMRNLAKEGQSSELLQKMKETHDREAKAVGYHVPENADKPPA